MNSERRFIQYDCRPAPPPDTADYLARFEGVRQLKMMSGYLMTVRANVAIAEPFDETLLAYAPAEDLDATYRFSRHGFLVSAPGGRVYHAEAPAGRLKRVTAKALSITNIAYFIRQKSTAQFRHIFAFYILSFRTIVAETLKDILNRRFEFPHLRGAFQGIVQSVGIFRTPRDELPASYDALQRKLLGIRK